MLRRVHAWFPRLVHGSVVNPQVPCADPTGNRTANLVVRYAWYLLPIPLAAASLDATSWMFAVEGTALNACLLYHAYRFDEDRSNSNARAVFKASLWHLPAILALFVFHSRRWIKENDQDQESSASSFIQRTRMRLKEACIHEVIPKTDAASFCPAVVVKDAGEKAELSTSTAQEDDAFTVV